MPTDRRTVDLSMYPNLVVIYLGMRVNVLTGFRTLLGFGPKIESAARPPGLLHHEAFLFSLFPPHAGIRQYWQDFESLERWTRSDPHRTWWKNFLRDSEGTGFWHETYRNARRHRSDLRRCPKAGWDACLCSRNEGTRRHVQRAPADRRSAARRGFARQRRARARSL